MLRNVTFNELFLCIIAKQLVEDVVRDSRFISLEDLKSQSHSVKRS